MYDNPMGTDGFDFVEFATTDPKPLETLFQQMGFTATQKHPSKHVTLFQQGDVKFILNAETNSFAENFYKAHGPSACGMAFRVKDAEKAYALALKNGAKAFEGSTDHIGKNVKAIYGIGDSLLYFIDQYGKTNVFEHSYQPTGAVPISSTGLEYIDHLTHNVFQGNMDKWAEFYERLFNFREIRYFDIQGQQTGLVSRALTSPCGKIKIPLNESKDDKSQIVEYLNEYKGEGIQHIAMTTANIYNTIEQMRTNEMSFMQTPDTYYELISKRLPEHHEDIARMQKNHILIDGGPEQGGGLLLQIFTNTVIGPIFFEIIQRKGNEGFGGGNFQALFDSIELDQIRRGVLAEAK